MLSRAKHPTSCPGSFARLRMTVVNTGRHYRPTAGQLASHPPRRGVEFAPPMPSVPPESSDLVNRLRQQLILAQVRLMELEDARDTLAPKVAELTAVVRTAQSRADQKLDEAAHLARVLADAQAHAAHLAQLHAQASADLAASRAQLATLETQLRQRDDLLAQNESVRAQLTAELRAIKASRTWRWTSWLRGSDRAS